MFRTILGVCAAYFAMTINSSGVFYFNVIDFKTYALVPLAVGAVAGFCWHMIAREKSDLD